jgi:hypothetical protein
MITSTLTSSARTYTSEKKKKLSQPGFLSKRRRRRGRHMTTEVRGENRDERE